MVCMQWELSRPPTFFNHVPDACLFGLGGLAFVTAWLWPGTVIFPTLLRWIGIAVVGAALVLIAATMSALGRGRRRIRLMRRRSCWYLARFRGRGIHCMWPMWWHCAAARWRAVPGWRWGAHCWGLVC